MNAFPSLVIGSRIPICNCYSSEHEISSKHGPWQRPCNQRATTTVTAETAYGHRGCGRFFLHDLLACFYSLLIQLYFLLDRGKRCPSAVVTCSKLVFLNSKLVVFVASPPPLEFPQEILREGVDAAAWAFCGPVSEKQLRGGHLEHAAHTSAIPPGPWQTTLHHMKPRTLPLQCGFSHSMIHLVSSRDFLSFQYRCLHSFHFSTDVFPLC